MWYRKEQNNQGDFIGTDGKHYILNECYRIVAPDGRMNAELGYSEFSTLEDCLKTWALTRIENHGRTE